MWTPPDGSKCLPILMNAFSVNALLDERKTQTRRAIKHQPQQGMLGDWSYFKSTRTLYATQTWRSLAGMQKGLVQYCPYGTKGSYLWVRETWNLLECYGTEFGGAPYEWDIYEGKIPKEKPQSPYTPGYDLPHSGMLIGYRATSDDPEADGPWRPSIFMPRWAARIWLQIEDVRVERVQDISEEDAIAEGVEQEGSHWKCYMCQPPRGRCYGQYTPTGSFRSLWNSIYEARGLGSDTNPWVWAIKFKVAYIC